MSVAPSAAESAVISMIGHSFSGESVPVVGAAESIAAEEQAVEKFEFDAAFQTRIAALLFRSPVFAKSVGHLLRPEYFENIGEATLVDLALTHLTKYRSAPDQTTLGDILREKIGKGVIKRDVAKLVIESRNAIFASPLTNEDFVAERVAEFAQHQAVSQALWGSVELLSKRKFKDLLDRMRKAVEVGINRDGDAYDYFAKIGDRTEARIDKASGKTPPKGITTGIPDLDKLLLHMGWGRGELATIMGGPKTGKTTALINFAKNAAIAGFNVLQVTLEVSTEIAADRADASISENTMKDVVSGKVSNDTRLKVEAMAKRAGKFMIHEYPSGTLTPNMLRALIERYRSSGLHFDFVVIDYADIMAPNFRYNDPIENSKTVYVDLRAIAQEYAVAMLTATQTNRDGYKATVAKAEHVAEDFNKVRTVDLMISINATEEERKNGEARLYFAASRNQESGFTVFIKQDIERMRFISAVLRIE